MRLEEIIATAEVVDLAISSSQAEQLQTYASLLIDRGIPLGVVSQGDAERLFERHILDCLRAPALVLHSDRRAYDLGSGGGLPGVVVAICCPALEVVLVDSRQRRAAFLELVVERLGLMNASVSGSRIETLRDPTDLCFARALARIDRAWALARPLLRPGGRLIYFAGEREGLPDGHRLDASRVEVVPRRLLESGGPLVIMTR